MPGSQTTVKLAGVIGAIGVVFGDIATSPLYTLQECLTGAHGVAPEPANVLGCVSLIVWSLLLVVTLKYVAVLMQADNRGEGGILALLAIVPHRERERAPGVLSATTVLVLIGAALLFGDGIITPAISVLSAVEGLRVAAPGLESRHRACHRRHSRRAVQRPEPRKRRARPVLRPGHGPLAGDRVRARRRSHPRAAGGIDRALASSRDRVPDPREVRRLPRPRRSGAQRHRRRSPLRRHGTLWPASHPRRLADLRAAGARRQLSGPGRRCCSATAMPRASRSTRWSRRAPRVFPSSSSARRQPSSRPRRSFRVSSRSCIRESGSATFLGSRSVIRPGRRWARSTCRS